MKSIRRTLGFESRLVKLWTIGLLLTPVVAWLHALPVPSGVLVKPTPSLISDGSAHTGSIQTITISRPAIRNRTVTFDSPSGTPDPTENKSSASWRAAVRDVCWGGYGWPAPALSVVYMQSRDPNSLAFDVHQGGLLLGGERANFLAAGGLRVPRALPLMPDYGLIINPFAYAALLWSGLAIWRNTRARFWSRGGRCATCGYAMVGLSRVRANGRGVSGDAESAFRCKALWA